MSIESADDWKGLRRAGRIAQLTLDALEASVRSGVSTADLDAVAARIFAEHGARSAPAIVYGFPGTVLISVNDEVVHGVPGRRRLAMGDLVKLDVTVEKDGYIADAARSVSSFGVGYDPPNELMGNDHFVLKPKSPAAFVSAYIPMPACGASIPVDDTFTMAPPPVAFIARIAYCVP